MKELVQKMNAMFGQGENKEMEASKKFWGNVGVASDIARSIRETGKFQVRAKPWRNVFFFLIVATLILFALSYVY